MTITFFQLIWNNMVGSEILFRLMLKCQHKNYPCLSEKKLLQLRNYKTLRLKFSDVPFGEFRICIEEKYKQISKVTIEIVLQFALCVNKISHLCYWSKTINDPCLKEVDGECRDALSNIEPNAERLCSFKQAQISHQNKSWSVFL